eukprot:1158819-Pelagomonas_calceolata.AAC.1
MKPSDPSSSEAYICMHADFCRLEPNCMHDNDNTRVCLASMNAMSSLRPHHFMAVWVDKGEFVHHRLPICRLDDLASDLQAGRQCVAI